MRGLCLMLIGLCALFPAAAQECKVATIAGSGDWSPFAAAGSDGRLGGAGVEIARTAFASLDVSVKLGEVEPLARTLGALESGRTDLMVAAYRTAERAERFLYTVPYAEERITVFMKASAPFPVTGLDALAGRTGVAPFGINFGDEIGDFLHNDPKLTYNTSKEGMFRQVLTPEVDYAILGWRNGEHVLAQLGLSGAIIPAPQPLAVNKIYMLMSRKSPCAGRLPALNAAIAALAADGTIDRLIAAAESS